MNERPPSGPEPAPSLRAQILATEHWALLAQRTTTQNELLARIALLLTLLSAGLVTIGLLGQVVDLREGFAAVAFAIVAFVWLVGVLTLVRVLSGSEDDGMYVLAMNRLRAAYVDLDPGVERYFVQSAFDDTAGLRTTYSFVPRSTARQLLASAAMFTLLIVVVLTGVLATTGLIALGVVLPVAIGAGLVAGLAFAAAVVAIESAQDRRADRLWVPYRPTPPAEAPADA